LCLQQERPITSLQWFRHSKCHLIASNQAKLATSLLLNTGFTIAEDLQKLLTHDRAKVVIIVTVKTCSGLLCRRVEHDPTEACESPDICCLRVSLNAEADLETHHILLCNALWPLKRQRLRAKSCTCHLAHDRSRLLRSVGRLHFCLCHVHIAAIDGKRLCACHESKATSIIVGLHDTKENLIGDKLGRGRDCLACRK
jgi:hypothetical protein